MVPAVIAVTAPVKVVKKEKPSKPAQTEAELEIERLLAALDVEPEEEGL